MNRIKYRISLDMFEVATQTTIKAKRGDTACSIHMTLTENGKIYHITDGSYAVFSAKKPDGNYLFNGETCRIEDNTIVYDFTEQTTSVEGIVECEVILYNGEDQLTSPRFNIKVDSTVYNGEDIISTPEADALKILIDEANAVIDEVETKLENGDFVGDKGDNGVSVTHSWDGTVLKVTSASGSSSADLKGDKGNKGDKGDKGDKGEPGDVTKEYVNGNFANALKGSSSGSAISLTDVSPVEHDVDVKVRSKNILPYPYKDTTVTNQGITYTDNGDCSITVSGTSTGFSGFYLIDSRFNEIIENGKTYTLSLKTLSGEGNVGMLGEIVRKSDNVIVHYLNTGNPTFTVDKNLYDYKYLRLQIPTTNTEVSCTVAVMLEDGSTATEYTPYVDVSTINLGVGGKNLFDYTLPYTVGGVLDENTGELINWGSGWCVYDYIEIQPNITCTVNSELNQNRYPICFYDENKVFISSAEDSFMGENNYHPIVFTTPPNCKYMRISAIIANASTSMIVLGEYTKEQMELMEYEPYVEPVEYSVNADGTVKGVASLYPSMSLLTDTSGVMIDAEYNKDTNKVIQNLVNAIIALGGNV